jgi:PAP2 superfamily
MQREILMLFQGNREIRAVAVMACFVLAYLAFVLFSTKVELSDFLQLFSEYLKVSATIWVVSGAMAFLVFRIFDKQGQLQGRRAALVRFFKDRFERDYFLSLIWPLFFFAILFASFNCFKQLVLVDYPFAYDAIYERIDRILFLGQDPWRVAHTMLPGVMTAKIVDMLYHAWFLPMTVGVFACAWLGSESWHLRTQYLFTYMFSWIFVGSFAASLFPAAGPALVPYLVDASSKFGELNETLALLDAQIGLDSVAIKDRLLLLHKSHDVVIGGGISAMPSVHIALSLAFALAALKINKTFGWCMVGYAVLMWIASLYLGWHYAVDGVVSLLLVWPAWILFGKLTTWIETAPSLFFVPPKTAQQTQS